MDKFKLEIAYYAALIALGMNVGDLILYTYNRALNDISAEVKRIEAQVEAKGHE